MKNSIIILTITLIFIIILALIVYFNLMEKHSQVCLKEKCYNIEIAKSAEERERGLMFREKLDTSSGMLFIFPSEGEYNFWMKNTLIPLDIIWINSDKEVVYIAENMQPCNETCNSINPGKKSKYVLEINFGEADRLGLKVGDKIRLN
ncbi:DUF192 domain-containing protein [Candidatus Pacearchaeota archaeon]|nr:DUF192 domain-containing protein [Candidatus Pacearchaeota archaeon]